MNEKIVAVVVTFNRKKYLIECLEAIKSQSYEIDNIIIIDNASNDETGKYLKELGWLDGSSILYVMQKKNLGGSGGFNAGIKIALETGASWIWVMDDDVAPKQNCLEELFRYRNVSECIHPIKIDIEKKDYCWEHQYDILTGGRTFIKNKSFENGKDIVFTNVACFEGMLASRRLIEKVGLPDSKYFISEDDTLFGLKASVHTNVSYVSRAIICKLIPFGDISPWKSFYLTRNRFYLFCDSCEYMELKPSFSNKLLFFISQIFELYRLLKRGSVFFVPSTKGFIVGCLYMLKNH